MFAQAQADGIVVGFQKVLAQIAKKMKMTDEVGDAGEDLLRIERPRIVRIRHQASGLHGGALASYHINFAIDPATIPRASYANVLSGRFEPDLFKGKDVLVGASAIQLGDMVTVPVYRALPGITLQALGYDLVLTDQTMPRVSGLELARQIHGIRPGTPVILYTGYGEDIAQNELAAAGVRALARKPVEPAELLALLTTHLQQIRNTVK